MKLIQMLYHRPALVLRHQQLLLASVFRRRDGKETNIIKLCRNYLFKFTVYTARIAYAQMAIGVPTAASCWT